MIVTRFCSQAEYDKLCRGEVLVNKTDHLNNGRGGATSVGFCFSPCRPDEAWKYLKGIVDFDVCLVLDFKDNVLIKSNGIYYDASAGNCRSLRPEYCAISYSLDVCHVLKVLKPAEFASPDEIEACKLVKRLRENYI